MTRVANDRTWVRQKYCCKFVYLQRPFGNIKLYKKKTYIEKVCSALIGVLFHGLFLVQAPEGGGGEAGRP